MESVRVCVFQGSCGTSSLRELSTSLPFTLAPPGGYDVMNECCVCEYSTSCPLGLSTYITPLPLPLHWRHLADTVEWMSGVWVLQGSTGGSCGTSKVHSDFPHHSCELSKVHRQIQARRLSTPLALLWRWRHRLVTSWQYSGISAWDLCCVGGRNCGEIFWLKNSLLSLCASVLFIRSCFCTLQQSWQWASCSWALSYIFYAGGA